MGKIKNYKSYKLVPAYVILAVLFLLGAMCVADIEREFIKDLQIEIAEQYTDNAEEFNTEKVWDAEGNQYVLTEADSKKMRRLDFFAYIFPHMAYICSTFLAGWVYYRRKLRKPLIILNRATARIADNDLNFEIEYDADDEFGHLCQAFEKMRSFLEQNSRETWRQMDERKRLNASFSHDLRTPLTVLEGHLDILQKYATDEKLTKEEIEEIYSVMSTQLKRMNRYVLSMSKLQSLEDIPISPKEISTEEFIATLRKTADIICASLELKFINDIKAKTVSIDVEIVLQVVENLLSNAVRYADSSITIVVREKGKHLAISISDDGKGFSQREIKCATDPFYTTEKKVEGDHFGLGLNISKVLCQRHGGTISIKNNRSRGANITVSFSIKE